MRGHEPGNSDCKGCRPGYPKPCDCGGLRHASEGIVLVEECDKHYSPLPWTLHRTGSHLGIKASNGKFVIRRAVNMLSAEAYEQVRANFEFICRCVNAAAGEI